MEFAQAFNLITLLFMVAVGFYCSCKLNDTVPLWVRLVILSPSLSAFYSISVLIHSEETFISADMVQRAATCLIYALVASKFTSSPWFDICRHPKGAESCPLAEPADATSQKDHAGFSRPVHPHSAVTYVRRYRQGIR